MNEEDNGNEYPFDLSAFVQGGAPEPLAEIRESMALLRQLYVASVAVGFTEHQAMQIVLAQVAAASGN